MELGWDIMRFWVYQIRDDLDQSVVRVLRWLEQGNIYSDIKSAPRTGRQ